MERKGNSLEVPGGMISAVTLSHPLADPGNRIRTHLAQHPRSRNRLVASPIIACANTAELKPGFWEHLSRRKARAGLAKQVEG